MMASPNSSASNVNEYCTEISRLTMECLAHQRRIREIKKTRESATQAHQDIQCEFQNRVKSASKSVKRAMHGNIGFEHYMDAAQSRHASLPSLYICRKEAELIKTERILNLFDTYISIMNRQNKTMRDYMKHVRDKECRLLNENQQLAFSIRHQLCEIVERNVKAYSKCQSIDDEENIASDQHQRICERRSSLERIFKMEKLAKSLDGEQMKRQGKSKSKIRVLNSRAA